MNQADNTIFEIVSCCVYNHSVVQEHNIRMRILIALQSVGQKYGNFQVQVEYDDFQLEYTIYLLLLIAAVKILNEQIQ